MIDVMLPKQHLWDIKHAYPLSRTNARVVYHNDWNCFTNTARYMNKDCGVLLNWEWRKELTLLYATRRRRRFLVHIISEMRPDNEPDVIKFLQKQWQYIHELWEPLSLGYGSQMGAE